MKRFFSGIRDFNIDFLIFLSKVKNGFVKGVFVRKMSHFVNFANRTVVFTNRTVIYTNRTVIYRNTTFCDQKHLITK